MAQRNYAHCLIDLFLYRPILNMLYITQVIQLIAASCGLLINDLHIIIAIMILFIYHRKISNHISPNVPISQK